MKVTKEVLFEALMILSISHINNIRADAGCCNCPAKNTCIKGPNTWCPLVVFDHYIEMAKDINAKKKETL